MGDLVREMLSTTDHRTLHKNKMLPDAAVFDQNPDEVVSAENVTNATVLGEHGANQVNRIVLAEHSISDVVLCQKHSDEIVSAENGINLEKNFTAVISLTQPAHNRDEVGVGRDTTGGGIHNGVNHWRETQRQAKTNTHENDSSAVVYDANASSFDARGFS